MQDDAALRDVEAGCGPLAKVQETTANISSRPGDLAKVQMEPVHHASGEAGCLLIRRILCRGRLTHGFVVPAANLKIEQLESYPQAGFVS